MAKGLFCHSCQKGIFSITDIGLTVENGITITLKEVHSAECLSCGASWVWDTSTPGVTRTAPRVSHEAKAIIAEARKREWDSQFTRQKAEVEAETDGLVVPEEDFQ